MRLYKSGYTKPMPAGAKIFSRKGVKYASYKDHRGDAQTARLTKAGDKILCETKKWLIEFDDHQQIRRQIKAYTNRQASQRLADRIQRLLNCRATNTPLDVEQYREIENMPVGIRDELIEFGVIPKPKAKRCMELVSLLAEYEEWLRETRHRHGYKRTEKHVCFACSRIRKINEQCGFENWDDIKSQTIEKYLGGLSIEPETYNGYVVMYRSFCKWVVESDYAEKSPAKKLKHLSEPNKENKRALTQDEVERLLDSTEHAEGRFAMSGHDRAVLYLFAIESGLRRGALIGLTVGDFDFENNIVNIRPEINKTRVKHTVYLKPHRAEQLKEYFRGKLPNVRAFRIAERTADMIKADLKAAQIPFKDAQGRKVVFHSLRYTTNTELTKITSDKDLIKTLMGHILPKNDMTVRYTTIDPEQLRDIAEQLPDYKWPQKQAAIMTGTDDRPVDAAGEILSKSYNQGAHKRTPTDNGGTHKALMKQKTPRQANNEAENCMLTAMKNNEKPTLPNQKQGNRQNEEEILLKSYFSDPFLAEIVSVWPKLPEHIKAAIKALIQAHKAKK